MLIMVSCHSLKDVTIMNVFYPYNDEYCFQLTIPETEQYGWYEVNGDRCYVFHYPLKNRLDTTKVFISHFGLEECDCSIHYLIDKILSCYNDSVLAEHFISSQEFRHSFIVKSYHNMDTLIVRSTKLEYDTSKYFLIEYLGYTSPIRLIDDTAFRHLENAKRYIVKNFAKKKMVYIDGTSVKDTLILDGYDKKKLYWKNIKINIDNINVGCVNVLPKNKRLYSDCLSSLKKIRISSLDTNKKNTLYFLPKQDLQ